MSLDTIEIVSAIGGIYADLNEAGKLLKPRSALPCSWHEAREYFTTGYIMLQMSLTEDQKHSFHHVYRELAFFIEDEIAQKCEFSMNRAIDHYIERYPGHNISRRSASNLLFGLGIKLSNREEMWNKFEEVVPLCPIEDRRRMSEVLGYCVQLHKLMWDEWALFVNYIDFLNRSEETVD